ncbi:MAG TPA: FMN-binding protein [Gemmatimonadaceae bacterium]
MTLPRDDAPRNPSQWIKGNLVGLGSAAVLAVYSAGYARTREAAQRFEGEDRQRHVAIPVAAVASAPEVAKKIPIPQPVPDAKATPAKSATPAPKPATKSTVTTDPTPSTPAADTTTVRADTAATTPQLVTQTPAPTDTTAKSEKTQVGWKDGTFTGWGGSRHGDIQATVEIKAGRIISAWISICATQYSCSWIDSLPGQVVSRQSPEVDFVSGATQSTNAFYYAVVQALQKAK